MRLHLLICLGLVYITAQEPINIRGSATIISSGPGIDCWIATTKTCNPNNRRLNQNSSVLKSFNNSKWHPLVRVPVFFFDKGVAECFIDEGSYTTVPSPPFDSISSIRYSPTNPDQLLLSSWDTVRYLASSFFGVTH
jgi:hypothetical protein